MRFSHISIAVHTKDLRKKVVAFYAALGLKVSSENDQETWMQLFGDGGASTDVSLQIVDGPNNTQTTESLPGLTARLDAKETPRLVLAAESITTTSTAIEATGCQSTIKTQQLDLPFVASTPGKQVKTLYAVDPAGTLVAVIESKQPINKTTTPSITAGGGGAGVVPLRDVGVAGTPPTPLFPKSSSIESLSPELDAYLPMDRVPHPSGGPHLTSKRIGVLTSGGDSSGMNAAVRAIARVALQRGCVPFAIYEGYEGLVDGGSCIKQLGWDDVKGYLSIGGTLIGSARSARFRTREGRLAAALNMVKNGIDALIVVGGDGSLTGADKMRAEWQGLLEELTKQGKLQPGEGDKYEHLTIVGLVGSIDNDMSSTDITIGAMTSLHRICESLDSLTSTAVSHQRAFIVEVMGRHCGWLALMAAISVGADWVFLPERPPPLDTAKYGENWEDEMCERLAMNRKQGSRKTLIIVAEGAIDRQLKPIKPEYIKSVIEKRLNLDTRVTTLGHVQRGGTPCAYDRYLATVQGVEAVEAVLRATPDTPSPMIGMSQNKITAGPLMDAVKLTHDVAAAISNKDFARAMELRDPEFSGTYDAYIESHLIAAEPVHPKGQGIRVAIIHVGAPAGGMNAATRTAARLCLNRGFVPLGIRNGFSGLVNGEIFPISWQQVITWQVLGGSELGTNRDHPEPVATAGIKIKPRADKWIPCGSIAYALQKFEVDALMIIGGFEAFTSLATLTAARSVFPAFCIPMVHLPATVSNNVPGTDFSIGSDTALNAIVESCDRIKLSATASQKRVFVMEVQGGNCGYLAVLAGLASGATNVYIPEEGITLAQLQQDIRLLSSRFLGEKENERGEGRVILRSEAASADTYTTDVVANILKSEGGGIYDVRTSVLGHLQQGGVPSPLDRIRATRLAVDCVNWIQKACDLVSKNGPVDSGRPNYYTTSPNHACVIGIRGANVEFSSVIDLLSDADMHKRRGKDSWWMGLRRLIKVLSKYYYAG